MSIEIVIYYYLVLGLILSKIYELEKEKLVLM